jgi:hypothetical protein
MRGDSSERLRHHNEHRHRPGKKVPEVMVEDGNQHSGQREPRRGRGIIWRRILTEPRRSPGQRAREDPPGPIDDIGEVGLAPAALIVDHNPVDILGDRKSVGEPDNPADRVPTYRSSAAEAASQLGVMASPAVPVVSVGPMEVELSWRTRMVGTTRTGGISIVFSSLVL